MELYQSFITWQHFRGPVSAWVNLMSRKTELLLRMFAWRPYFSSSRSRQRGDEKFFFIMATCLSTSLSVCRSIPVCVCLYTCLSACLSACLFVFLSVCRSTYLYVCVLFRLPISYQTQRRGMQEVIPEQRIVSIGLCSVAYTVLRRKELADALFAYILTYLCSEDSVSIDATSIIHVLICDTGAQTPSPFRFWLFYWIIFYTASASKYLLQNQNISFLTEIILVCLERSKKWKKSNKMFKFFVSS